MTPATPDTGAYFHAAYIIAGVLYAGYTVSLWWRARAARSQRVDFTAKST
jgi:hypothetical protein